MKTIYGVIGGLAAGFVTTVILAPRSGKATRKKISDSASKNYLKARMGVQKAAYKLGIGSRKKIAELTQERMHLEKEKQNKASVDPTVRTENDSLKKVHEKDAAQKAVDSSTAKSHLRKVPTNAK